MVRLALLAATTFLLCTTLFSAESQFTPNRFKNTAVATGTGNQNSSYSIFAPSYGAYTAGVFAVYRDDATNTYGTLKLSRIDDTGAVVAGSVVNSDASNYLGKSYIVLSGAYSIVCFERGGTIYASRRDASGAAYLSSSWSGYPSGKPIITTSYTKYDLNMVSDGANGIIMAWREKRGSYYQAFVQRVDVNGYAKWGLNGRLVWSGSYNMLNIKLAPSASGSAIVTWTDDRGPFGTDIYAQRVYGADSASFSLLWGSSAI